MNTRGLTLVETVAAALIVLLLSGAVAGFSHGILHAHDTHSTQDRAHELALSLMDEIIPLRFEDPDGDGTLGPEAGEWGAAGVRTLFDDVDDYVVWIGDDVVQSKTGVALPYPGWSRAVSVVHVSTSDFANDSGSQTDVKRIRVSVIASGDTLSTMETIRVRGGRHVDFIG